MTAYPSQAEIDLLKPLAGLIRDRPPEETEGALVACYEFLIGEVQDPRFAKRERMVVLSLFPLDEDAENSSEVQKANDVQIFELPPEGLQLLDQTYKGLPPELGSGMLLVVSEGSTKWCKITSTGVKCYTRG